MKREIPMLIAFVVGVVMFVQFFIPSQASQNLYKEALNWLRIIFMFSILLGVMSVLRTHGTRIQRKSENWQYSVFAVAGLFISAVAGLGWGVEKGSLAQWIYTYIQIPIQGTMFSLLAFFIASAAYRAFRARSALSAALLVSAIIVMLGRAPIGDAILRTIGVTVVLEKFGLEWFTFQNMTDWILNVPNLASKRAIQIGVGLGIIATSLKIILGIERSYLGGGK